MIVFDLACPSGHRFEGWFGSSADFAAQSARGLLTCPECGSAEVAKAPMAANLARKGNQISAPVAGRQPAPPVAPTPSPAAAPPSAPVAGGAAIPPAIAEMYRALAGAQREALKDSRWVGDRFAEESRAMHYGEQGAEAIHGETTAEEARALHEEGIELMPLLFPVVPPGEAN